MKDFHLSDRILALVAPAIGGGLFFAIALIIDILAGRQQDFLSPGYILENAIFAAAGALLTTSLFLARYLINTASQLEKNYLQIPWDTRSSERPTQMAKIALSGSMQKLFRTVDSRIVGPVRHLALATVQMQLEEQVENIKLHGRIQFINPGPNSSVFENIDAGIAENFFMDGYCLVFNQAKQGDVIHATDFQNSNYWWLDPKVAFDFFSMNLQVLQKGVRIIRIFGRNHIDWEEDETGTKQQLIELQARIKGFEIYTIEYADFAKSKAWNFQPIDQLLLKRAQHSLPAIEWVIDEKGNAEKVYMVFGEGRLAEMEANFALMLDSGKRGSTLQHIALEKVYDPSSAEDLARIEKAFAKISREAF